MNYPLMDVPYTRIVEYKHKPNQPKGVHEKKACGEPSFRSLLLITPPLGVALRLRRACADQLLRPGVAGDGYLQGVLRG